MLEVWWLDRNADLLLKITIGCSCCHPSSTTTAPARIKIGQQEEVCMRQEAEGGLAREEAYLLSVLPPALTHQATAGKETAVAAVKNTPLACHAGNAIVHAATALASIRVPVFPPLESPLPLADPLPWKQEKSYSKARASSQLLLFQSHYTIRQSCLTFSFHLADDNIGNCSFCYCTQLPVPAKPLPVLLPQAPVSHTSFSHP